MSTDNEPPHYIEPVFSVSETTLRAVIDALSCGQEYVWDRVQECAEQKTLKDRVWHDKLRRDNQLLQDIRDKVSSLMR